MILSQKFHSAKEIDPEFIEPIEHLLKNELPSFDWILTSEESSPQSINFTYYLFFGPNHNSPIGFARAEIENKESEPNFLSRLVKSSRKTKHINWRIPGVSSEGIIIDPQYTKEAFEKVTSITQEYNQRKDINSQSVRLDSLSANALLTKNAHTLKVINGLLKSQPNYQGYFESLNPLIQKSIKLLWKELYNNPNFKLESYNSIKEAFSYKNDGAEKLKELKQNPLHSLYSKQVSKVITLENNGSIESIVFFFTGKDHYLFSDFYKFSEEIDTDLLIQVAIMHFYEEDEFNTLHFLRGQREVNRFVDLGFRLKSQNLIVLKDHD